MTVQQEQKAVIGVKESAKTVAQHVRQRTKEEAEILKGIEDAKQELELANHNFSFATDPLLIDFYAYQMKAAQSKYRYLLGCARKLGLEQREYAQRALQDRVREF